MTNASYHHKPCYIIGTDSIDSGRTRLTTAGHPESRFRTNSEALFTLKGVWEVNPPIKINQWRLETAPTFSYVHFRTPIRPGVYFIIRISISIKKSIIFQGLLPKLSTGI